MIQIFDSLVGNTLSNNAASITARRLYLMEPGMLDTVALGRFLNQVNRTTICGCLTGY